MIAHLPALKVGLACTAALALAAPLPAFAAADLPGDATPSAAVPDEILADVQAIIHFGDGRLLIDTETRLSADGLRAIAFGKAPWPLPVLMPLARQPDGQNVQITALSAEADGGLRAQPSGRQVLLTGTAAAQQPAVIRTRTVATAAGSTVRLAITGAAAKTWLRVLASADSPSRPRLTALLPARTTDAEDGGKRLAALGLARPILRGQTVEIALEDSPAADDFPYRLVALALAFAGTAAAAVLVGRKLGKARN